MKARVLLGGVLMLMLVGCGFHLRAWDLETNVKSATVAAQGHSVLDEPLRRSLRNSGVDLVEDGAQITIALLDEQRVRRGISVNDRARTEQFELTLNIQYEIRGENGDVLLSPRWIQALRIYRVDRDNLVGSSEEQVLLEREMVNDLVQQLMRSLNAVTRESAVAA